MASDIIERWKASAYTSALSTALTIYPSDPSPSTLTV